MLADATKVDYTIKVASASILSERTGNFGMTTEQDEKTVTRRNMIGKYASMMNRFSHMYYDGELSVYGIGGGQQFFLLQIAQMPGISLMSLAKEGNFDKGTTARAVQKLEQLGYVQRVSDERDRRITRFFVTEAAWPAIQATWTVAECWRNALTRDIPEDEQAAVERIMGKMAENAYGMVKGKGKDDGNE